MKRMSYTMRVGVASGRDALVQARERVASWTGLTSSMM